MTPRLAGGLLIVAGIVLLVLAGPSVGRRPLYDGVVVTQPYQFLDPAPGEAADPTSFNGVFDVFGGGSPILSASTGESPPQASVFANQGDLQIGPATSSFTIDIEPVEPSVPFRQGKLAGNAYAINITDQSGAALFPTPGGGFSIVLRQPEEISGKATMVLDIDGDWYEVPSSDSSGKGFYVATPPELGTFALLVGARQLPSLPPFSPPTPAPSVPATATVGEASSGGTRSAAAPTLSAPTANASPVTTPTTSELPVPPATAQTSSTSLIVAAALVMLALAAIAAAIALRWLPRHR